MSTGWEYWGVSTGWEYWGKLKTFYRSCMNVYNYMKDWLEPLRRQIVTGLCEYWVGVQFRT